MKSYGPQLYERGRDKFAGAAPPPSRARFGYRLGEATDTPTVDKSLGFIVKFFRRDTSLPPL